MPPFPNIGRIGLTFDLLTWISIGIIYSSRTFYLLSKASGAKRYWVIRCTRFGRLTWPWTLAFDLNIKRDHLLIKDYLSSLKVLGQRVLELSVAQGLGDWHDLWNWPLTCISIGIIYSSAYQVWRFWGKTFLSYQLHKGYKGYWHTDRHEQRNMPLLLRRGGINIDRLLGWTELRIDKRTEGQMVKQTDDPITRCPRRTFQAGHKNPYRSHCNESKRIDGCIFKVYVKETC